MGKITLTFKELKELIKLGFLESKSGSKRGRKVKRYTRKQIQQAYRKKLAYDQMGASKADSSHLVASTQFSNTSNLNTDTQNIQNKIAEAKLKQALEDKKVQDALVPTSSNALVPSEDHHSIDRYHKLFADQNDFIESTGNAFSRMEESNNAINKRIDDGMSAFNAKAQIWDEGIHFKKEGTAPKSNRTFNQPRQVSIRSSAVVKDNKALQDSVIIPSEAESKVEILPDDASDDAEEVLINDVVSSKQGDESQQQGDVFADVSEKEEAPEEAKSKPKQALEEEPAIKPPEPKKRGKPKGVSTAFDNAKKKITVYNKSMKGSEGWVPVPIRGKNLLQLQDYLTQIEEMEKTGEYYNLE